MNLKLMSLLILSLSLLITSRSQTISSYWANILPKICSPDSRQMRNALKECDRLMDHQVKTIFSECLREVLAVKQQDQPSLCYYQRNARQLEDCRAEKYRTLNYNLTKIIKTEHKHIWCMMKVSKPLGWEQLCVNNLSQKRRIAIRKCEESFREISNPINSCYLKVIANQRNQPDGRPSACRTFEYPMELSECLQRITASSNDARYQQLEERAISYMECLRRVDERQRNTRI